MPLFFNSYFPIFIFLGFYSTAFAQQDSLQVSINKSYFKAKDTIHITAAMPPKKIKNATLFLMAEHEAGMVWEMRWPILSGFCNVNLIIPDSLPQGQYRFYFTSLQNLFTIFGKVKSPADIDKLNCTLINDALDLYDSETAINSDGTFTYKNVLFQHEATIIFSLPEASDNTDLNIEISTVLDSLIYPGISITRDIYIGNKEPETGLKKFVSKNEDPDSKVKLLETVTVYSKPSNRGDVFNKKYSSGLFNDINERIINLLDYPPISNAIPVLQLVSMQTPGINLSGNIPPYVIWRGEPVSFYLDEMKVGFWDVERTPVSDIAIIKVYPPPFLGNFGSLGGAIAVYTKRGGFSDDSYKNAFKVKGYTPLISAFPVHPDRF